MGSKIHFSIRMLSWLVKDRFSKFTSHIGLCMLQLVVKGYFLKIINHIYNRCACRFRPHYTGVSNDEHIPKNIFQLGGIRRRQGLILAPNYVFWKNQHRPPARADKDKYKIGLPVVRRIRRANIELHVLLDPFSQFAALRGTN